VIYNRGEAVECEPENAHRVGVNLAIPKSIFGTAQLCIITDLRNQITDIQ
jgi:hypothetical protein